MGSWVGSMTDCHLACVYCSTYSAIEDCVKSDTKWFDMLQLGGQVRRCFTSFQYVDTWLHCLICMDSEVSSSLILRSIAHVSKMSLIVSDFLQLCF